MQLEVAGRAITVQICTNDLLSLQQFMNVFGWLLCICAWSCHSLMCLIFLVSIFHHRMKLPMDFCIKTTHVTLRALVGPWRGSFRRLGEPNGYIALTGAVESSRNKRKKHRVTEIDGINLSWWASCFPFRFFFILLQDQNSSVFCLMFSEYNRIGNMAPSNPPTTKGISSGQGNRLEPASGSSWVMGSGVGDTETLIWMNIGCVWELGI